MYHFRQKNYLTIKYMCVNATCSCMLLRYAVYFTISVFGALNISMLASLFDHLLHGFISINGELSNMQFVCEV